MKADELFMQIINAYEEWIKTKPTGKFGFSIKVTDGNVRGNPKFFIEEEAKAKGKRKG